MFNPDPPVPDQDGAGPDPLALPLPLVPPLTGARDDYIPDLGGTVHHLSGDAIGTKWHVTYVGDQTGDNDLVFACFYRALNQVIAQMSQWEPTSELSRFNAADAGTKMTISRGFSRVLDCALVLAQRSNGAFDPALGQESEAWGFGSVEYSDLPDSENLYRTHAPTRWHDIVFDPDGPCLTQTGTIRLDLSGIAKGYAVDLVSASLRKAGVKHHLVDIGGELRASGVKPDGQPWWVEVESVPEQTDMPCRIALSGWSVATSGDWHRRRKGQGREWSHTLSARTGRPVENGNRAVTVLHREAMQADGLATLLMALPFGEACHFADSQGVPARITGSDGPVHSSKAWQAMQSENDSGNGEEE
ncbi:MAG: FAD:protein FMN transferase [Sphingomonadaceae bacterium]